MSISLNAEQKSLKDVFTRSEKYVIPLYQRPYSWGYDECLQLYTDLIESFENDEAYFLGNIIIARSTDTKTKDELEVIDGQQRLTTLILLFKAIKLLYPKTYKSLDRAIWIEDEETDEKYPKLVTKIFEILNEKKNLERVINIDKDEFLNEYRICFNNKGEEINLKCLNKNFRENKFLYNLFLFYKWFDYYFGDNIDKFRDFIKFLLEQVYMLPIELVEENKDKARNKALMIFERINNRGLNLSDADIFKSYLYSKADNKNNFAKYWSDIKNQAEDLGYKIDDIFRFYSHIVRGEKSIISSEISLRDFFTIKDYSPFKQKLYKDIMDDLYKIIETIKTLNNRKKSNKWLQILDYYTNQYPKIALVCYIYKNNFDNKIDSFLERLTRYVYMTGSTSYVKFEIYKIIDKIFKNQEIDSYKNEKYTNDDFYMGRLKKGFYLLSYYLDNEVAGNYSVNRIFTSRELIECKLEEFYESIANFSLYIEKNELKKLLLDSESFKEREMKLQNNIVQFMRGNK